MKNKVVQVYFPIAIITLFIVGLIYRAYQSQHESELLKNSLTTYGIVKEIRAGAVRSPKDGIFKYEVNKKEFELEQDGDFSFLQIGDTVLVEYAVEDHSVARVSDRYYMQKRRH